MDLEKALDIGALERSLCFAGDKEPGLPPWLEASWKEPASFWEGLWERAKRISALHPASVPFRHYDFYHDTVHRFEDSGRQAMKEADGKEGWKGLSFAALGQKSLGLASLWMDSGAEKGKVVALVFEEGETLMLTLLAAFRLGMVVSPIPPRGRRLLAERLKNLSPDFVVAEDMHASLRVFSGFRRLAHEALQGKAPGSDIPFSSSGYVPQETAALLFDPTCPEPCIPRPVTAQTLYLGSLRDGMLAMGLKPGDAYAAPGFNPMEIQPSLMLSGLLAGACLVCPGTEDMEKKALQLASVKLRILGVSRAFRESLDGVSVDLGKNCSKWFRHPGEGPPSQGWNDFMKEKGLEKAFAFNFVWNASLGGACLFSAGLTGRVHGNVLPAAGVRWRMGDMADPSLEAAGFHGIFMPSSETGDCGEDAVWMNASAMLSPHGRQWLFSPLPHTGAKGLYYPRKEALDALGDVLPPPSFASLVFLRPQGFREDIVCRLLVFLPLKPEGEAEKKQGHAALLSEIRTCLARELGEAFVPDQVIFLPLFPLLDEEGRVDEQWCASQYLTGRLQRKARYAVFQKTGALKALCTRLQTTSATELP
ncbi:AMP-binding enzyme [Desulfobotulus alkaliphilus]|uniref:AMP-binding enzyme n=1 Tax=Desulfobotulus alkaliphilus TaxID=622671 RepID=A0A562RE57_9BACT|nr:AMP-binding protein [Desulfobotulus alkaliphilus]TWI66680.1 AMP-binding enzyme [Desulfobotulus alkaliphilus]